MVPRLIFDTSAINALEDGGADFNPQMRRLAWNFEVVLTYISIEEIVSTTCPKRRANLLSRFKRLLRPWMCILPPSKIIRAMISAHQKDPIGFDWRKVDVGMPDRFYPMLEHDEFDEQLSIEQRTQNREFEKAFKAVLKEVRPALDAMDPRGRPATFNDTLSQANGFEMRFARSLYERHSGVKVSAEQMKEFISACPPMNCAGLSQLMGFHRWSLRNQSGGKDPGGRNDLLAAVYLPYSDYFVTDDYAQHEELAEIARVAGLECHVQTFDEFRRIATE